VPLDEAAGVQVAYSISRKVGGAVVRNRWRRRVRSAIATSTEHFPPGAYLISLAPEVTRLTYEELRERVIVTMRRASRGER
jgi:ribonuclease P protein component